MTKDEFFKEALIIFFTKFSKEKGSSIFWNDEFGSYVITLKTNRFEYILRIYDSKISMLTSHPAYSTWNSDFNIKEFKNYFDEVYKDTIPF